VHILGKFLRIIVVFPDFFFETGFAFFKMPAHGKRSGLSRTSSIPRSTKKAKTTAVTRAVRSVRVSRLIRDLTNVEFRYSTNFDVSGIVSYWTHGFRANGMYDPDAGVGGHQPLGFDQYMALYSRYEVVTSKIDVQLWATDPAIAGYQLAIIKSRDQGASSKEAVRELPTERCVYKIGPAGYSSNDGAGKAFGLSSYMNVPSFLGTAVGSSDGQGTATTDPDNQCYWVVRVDDVGTAVLKMFVFVTITYVARLSGMVTIDQS